MAGTKTRKPSRKVANPNTILMQVWVSPELYSIVDSAATLAGITLAEVLRRQIMELRTRQERVLSSVG
jgi:hypothetical protein